MAEATALTDALQDYLEAIYHLERERHVARPRDIAEAVGVHKSTVTSALHGLADRGMLNYEPYEAATLTEEGRARARRIAARHLIIREFLETVLDVEPESADANARRMQHAVDERALERIVCFLAFLRRESEESGRLLEEFRRFAERTAERKSCEEWIEDYLGRENPA